MHLLLLMLKYAKSSSSVFRPHLRSQKCDSFSLDCSLEAMHDLCAFQDRLRLTWLLQWPNFRWSGFAMYRQQQLKNVRHDLICTPCPEALREQISHCPVKRTWRFLPAFVVMLLVHVSLEVCIVVNGRYHCDNDQ